MKRIVGFFKKRVTLFLLSLLVLFLGVMFIIDWFHETKISSKYLETRFFVNVQEIFLSDGLKLIETGEVEKAVIINKSLFFLNELVLRAKLKDGTIVRFNLSSRSNRPLADEIKAQGGDVQGDKPVIPGTMIVAQMGPFFLFIIVILWSYRTMGGLKGVQGFLGRTARKLTGVPVTFKDVAGIDQAIAKAEELVESLRDPQSFKDFGYKIPRGYLFHGPPGCGKTLLARAIAGQANVPFFAISASEIEGILVGAGANKLLELFDKAEKAAPAIIFIDEFEIVGRSRGGGFGDTATSSREQTTATLFTLMDGIENSGKIVVLIAATNRKDLIDPALLRPGRFSQQIYVGEPARDGREAILKIHAKQRPIAEGVDFKKIARFTPGFSGAYLADLVNFAAGRARGEYKNKLAGKLINNLAPKEITMQHFLEAMDEVLAGPAKELNFISPKEKEIVATHESGHAILARILPATPSPKRVSVTPHERALGYMWNPEEEDKRLRFLREIKETLSVLLAGREAEKLIFFGDCSTGISGDLKQATALARKIIFEFGSQYLGGEGDQFYSRPSEISEDKRAFLENEVEKLLEKAAALAAQILKREDVEPVFNKLRETLLREQELEGVELEEIFKAIRNLPNKPSA